MTVQPQINPTVRDGSVVVVQGWPATLTHAQLRAYTNWPNKKIDKLTKENKINARPDGRSGSLLWQTSSVDKQLELEYGESSDFF